MYVRNDVCHDTLLTLHVCQEWYVPRPLITLHVCQEWCLPWDTDHTACMSRMVSAKDNADTACLSGKMSAKERSLPRDTADTACVWVADSPQWRKGPGSKPVLCNACGTRFLRTRSLGKVTIASTLVVSTSISPFI